MVNVGEKALDFELPSTIGNKIRLSNEIGKFPIVLLFYPLDWSPVCSNEICSIRDSIKEFEELNAKIFGISVDSIFSHKAWSKNLGLEFPLLSDFNKEVSRLYDVLHEEILGLKGISKRSVFIIDNDGIIRYKWVSEDPSQLPNIGEIKTILKRLRP
jgi:peroxiredoxin